MHEGFFIDHIYTEVFIISFDCYRFDSTKHQQIKIYTEPFEVIESLNSKSISYRKDIKIVHGCLLPATILPDNFNGVNAFILVSLPNTDYGLFTGDVFHSSEKLATAIQTTINYNKIEIENIFILYGIRIALTLSISEDELDEELVERGIAIIREVKQIKRKLGIGDDAI